MNSKPAVASATATAIARTLAVVTTGYLISIRSPSFASSRSPDSHARARPSRIASSILIQARPDRAQEPPPVSPIDAQRLAGLDPERAQDRPQAREQADRGHGGAVGDQQGGGPGR